MDLRESTGSVQVLSRRVVEEDIFCSRAMASISFLREGWRMVDISINRSGYCSTMAMDRVVREGGGLLVFCNTEIGCQVGDQPSPVSG